MENLEKIINAAKKLGKDRFVLLFLAGIMLLMITFPMKGNESEKETEEDAKSKNVNSYMEIRKEEGDEETLSEDDYQKRLCMELEEFLSKMQGVGNVKVYLTISSSEELIVERNSPYTKRSEEETQDGKMRKTGEIQNSSEVVVIEDSQGTQSPIVVKTLSPLIKGVVVAAQGADNPLIKKEITELMMALFGIDEHKIKVVKFGT